MVHIRSPPPAHLGGIADKLGRTLEQHDPDFGNIAVLRPGDYLKDSSYDQSLLVTFPKPSSSLRQFADVEMSVRTHLTGIRIGDYMPKESSGSSASHR